MDFPIELQIYEWSINLHLIFESLAFIIGYRYYTYLRKESDDTISTFNRINIIIGAAVGALIGSRLLGAMEQPIKWMASDNFWLYLYTNKTIVGGLVGGLVGVKLTKKILKINNSSGDLFTYPLILALLIGRIGCFTMGIYEQTYGIESSLPWAMDLGDNLSRHPVVLYEMMYLILLWFFLKQFSKNRNLVNGQVFQLFMIFYMTYRFLQDFIKPVYLFPHIKLSSIQIVCLLILLYYNKTILSLFTKVKK